MIAQLTGKVLEIEPKALIVDVNGVGYRVRVVSSLESSVQVGQPVTLRIYHQISDDNEVLFGFATKEDLRFFELLLTVPSVGPKTALNILDVAPPKTLAQAVATGDIKLLTNISGVGRKTADRILVELKSKFKDLPITGIVGDIHQETMSVLINMGYSRSQAREVVQNLPTGVESVEEAIRTVLKTNK
jgi:holliday junction DNA helicase RuvA